MGEKVQKRICKKKGRNEKESDIEKLGPSLLQTCKHKGHIP